MTDDIKIFEIETKKLPFDRELPLPQRLRMRYRSEVIELTYRRNSFDGYVHLTLKKLSNNQILGTYRLTEGSFIDIRNPESGLWYFVIYVRELSANDINIDLFDDEFKVEEVED